MNSNEKRRRISKTRRFSNAYNTVQQREPSQFVLLENGDYTKEDELFALQRREFNKQTLEQQINQHDNERRRKFRKKQIVDKDQLVDTNIVVKIASQNEGIVQVLLVLPLALMICYILFVEKGDLFVYVQN